jgi:hypothetical protein
VVSPRHSVTLESAIWDLDGSRWPPITGSVLPVHTLAHIALWVGALGTLASVQGALRHPPELPT